MLLQIHDELVFECPRNHVGSLVDIIRDEMEHAMPLRVPLVVDVAAGPNWLDLETIIRETG
jgi:DNA polymerase-1